MSRSLDDLRPEFRALVDPWLADCKGRGYDILVTCTLRTMAEQAALYAQGRTAPGAVVTRAKPGQSAHQYGLALDFVPMVNGKPDWNGQHPIWHEIGDLALAHGMEWLGTPGSPFVEFAHLQAPKWKLMITEAA